MSTNILLSQYNCVFPCSHLQIYLTNSADAKAEKVQMSAPTKEAKADKTYSLSMGKAEKNESMRF